MTPIKIETIQDKLFRLNEYTKLIEDSRKYSDDEIIRDPSLYYSLEHMLQLSIQIILDIGTHILVEDFNNNPKTYAEVIETLGTRGIISLDFAHTQVDMAKFRNKLVHDYDAVDKEKTVTYTKLAPAIFRTFGKAFVTYIESKK